MLRLAKIWVFAIAVILIAFWVAVWVAVWRFVIIGRFAMALTVTFLPLFLIALTIPVLRKWRFDRLRRAVKVVLLLMLLVNIWFWGIVYWLVCGLILGFGGFRLGVSRDDNTIEYFWINEADIPGYHPWEGMSYEELKKRYPTVHEAIVRAIETEWGLPAWIGLPLYYIGEAMPIILVILTFLIIFMIASTCKPRKCEVQQQ